MRESEKPFSQQRMGRFAPQRLTEPVRRQLLQQFAVAREADPELSVRAFAEWAARQLPLSAARIRQFLYDMDV